MTELSENDWEFQLSMAIREYIDKKYQTHFINGKYEVIGMINSEDIKFINNLDRNKFSKENQLLKDETLKKSYRNLWKDKRWSKCLNLPLRTF